MKVAYAEAGTGLPVVFLPGLVGTRDWFRYQVSGLSESYRVMSYDVRSARNVASYTLDLLTEDLARFLTSLKLQFAVIVGHSFGAMVAQRFALAYPQMTEALVLVSAFPTLEEKSPEAIIDALSPGQVRVESALQSFLSKIFPHKLQTGTREETDGLEWLTSHSATLSRTTLAARTALIGKFDSRDWLEQIEAPTLVIVGAKDKTPFLAGAQTLYEGIPNAELEVIEEGDHFCFYTRHDLVNRAIDDFLKDRLSSGARAARDIKRRRT